MENKRKPCKSSGKAMLKNDKKKQAHIIMPTNNGDWILDFDTVRQRTYYYNVKTQETCWKVPNKSLKRKQFNPLPKLPPSTDWKIALDRSTGRYFYYHPRTQQTSWTSPIRKLVIGYKINRGYLECTLVDSLTSIRSRLSKEWDPDMLPKNSTWVFALEGNVRISQKQEENSVLNDLFSKEKDEDLILYILDRPKRGIDKEAQIEPLSKKASTVVTRKQDLDDNTHGRQKNQPPPPPPQEKKSKRIASRVPTSSI